MKVQAEQTNRTSSRLRFVVVARLLTAVMVCGLATCGGGGSGTQTPPGPPPNPITSNTPPFRTRYVRTDAAVPYLAWLNSRWIIYNAPTSRFFVTDPGTNQVFALDAGTETVVGRMRVPGAFTLDDTPDHKTLYVGTQIGDVYVIDPVGMTVTRRFLSAQIGPSGFGANSALVMADGRLALLGGQGGIPSVDGDAGFAIWNPVDNSMAVYASGYGAAEIGLPFTQICGPMGNIGVFTRTPDRTKVLVASIFSDGTLCEVDESGSFTYVQTSTGFIWHVAVSPDGNWIVLPSYPGQAAVLDGHTLAPVTQFNVAGDTSSAAGFAVSADSKTLYAPSASIVYAYDLTTGLQTGWLPNLVVEPGVPASAVSPISGPDIQAMDGTGLLAGPMEEGVGFLDISTIRTGAVGTQFTNAYLNPATGPTGGGTQITIPAPSTISNVYFGSQKTMVSTPAGTPATVTTPPGAPGPADVYVQASDGGMQIIPEGFSYGPTVLEITPNAAVLGGGPGTIYGYGFGLTDSNAIPSDLQVTVGSKAADIIAFDPNPYGVSAPPFLLQAPTCTIPAGLLGSAAVTVSTNSGSVTVQGGITYLPAVQQFPLSGSALAQGVYDARRDVFYFTDTNIVRVFSRTQGKWLAPITVPAPAPGLGQRLWGISLSPDGNWLAIADAMGQAIYLVNPDSPSVVGRYPVSQPATGAIKNPAGVAISDGITVYFTAFISGGTGYSSFFKLDTSSSLVTDYGIDGPGTPSDNYLRTAISQDNSRVYFNNEGAVFSINTADDSRTYAKDNPGCCYGDYDLALSMNQAAFAATGYFYDSSLNAQSYVGLNIREANVSYLYGEKLSPDGTMLFQPTSTGIDVIDARLGNLLTRIALPMSLSPNYDALVSDGKDNVLVAITGTAGDGIAVIDLSSLPEPAPLPYEAAARTARRSAGVQGVPPSQNGQSRPRVGNRTGFVSPRRLVPHVMTTRLLTPITAAPLK